MDAARLARLDHEPGLQARARAHEVVVERGDREERRHRRPLGAERAVGEDEDVDAVRERLVVQVVGSVNATALIFAGVGPVLLVPYAIWVTKEVDWRRALGVVLKIGLLTVVASLWWMAGLWAQGSYGLNVLDYSETLEAVTRTSFAPEVLRGFGYWFLYGRDKVGPWIEASVPYTQNPLLILVSFGLPSLSMLSAATVALLTTSSPVVGSLSG